MKNKLPIISLLVVAIGVAMWGVVYGLQVFQSNTDVDPSNFDLSNVVETIPEPYEPKETDSIRVQSKIQEQKRQREEQGRINALTGEWKTYQNKEVGISFKYPDIFKRTDMKIIKGDTGRMLNGVLEFAPNHWISFGGVTEDFSQAKGGSILDTLGYEKNGGKYFLKFIFGKNEVVPGEFWKVNGGKNEAIVIRDTEIEQILSNKDTAVFVNIPKSPFHGIVFSITPQDSGEPISTEEVEILHKIVSSIVFE